MKSFKDIYKGSENKIGTKKTSDSKKPHSFKKTKDFSNKK